jgi:hypothetical protein
MTSINELYKELKNQFEIKKDVIFKLNNIDIDLLKLEADLNWKKRKDFENKKKELETEKKVLINKFIDCLSKQDSTFLEIFKLKRNKIYKSIKEIKEFKKKIVNDKSKEIKNLIKEINTHLNIIEFTDKRDYVNVKEDKYKEIAKIDKIKEEIKILNNLLKDLNIRYDIEEITKNETEVNKDIDDINNEIKQLKEIKIKKVRKELLNYLHKKFSLFLNLIKSTKKKTDLLIKRKEISDFDFVKTGPYLFADGILEEMDKEINKYNDIINQEGQLKKFKQIRNKINTEKEIIKNSIPEEVLKTLKSKKFKSKIDKKNLRIIPLK